VVANTNISSSISKKKAETASVVKHIYVKKGAHEEEKENTELVVNSLKAESLGRFDGFINANRKGKEYGGKEKKKGSKHNNQSKNKMKSHEAKGTYSNYDNTQYSDP
jgi:hypothetical protein